MPRSEDARGLALEVLLAYQRRDAYLNALLFSALSRSALDRRDRALVTELVQGTVRMLRTADWALEPFSNRDLSSLDPEVLWILRLSAYQLLFTDVPDYAAVDSGATLARSHSGAGAVAYVNAVLRALAAEKGSLTWPDPERDPAGYLEIRYSHPRWLAEVWLRELGYEKAESVCVADNSARPVSVRCNLSRAPRDALAKSILSGGGSAVLSEMVPEGLLLKGTGPVTGLEEFERGLLSVQDQGAILVGHAVAPEPGMSVLDVCAAPGGKANHLAELMHNEGTVLALDVNASRLALVDESAARLGNRIVATRVADATRASESISDGFDRVLVDAPCSGLGTLSSKPDVRWRKSEADLAELARLQAAILTEAAKMVAPGGLMVYSTCTISKAENEGVVERFLQGDRGFEPAGPGALERVAGGADFIQLFPDTHGCDGTFIARLRRG